MSNGLSNEGNDFSTVRDLVKKKSYHEWEVCFCTSAPISNNSLAAIVVTIEYSIKVCAQLLSPIWLFATLWTVAWKPIRIQLHLSMSFKEISDTKGIFHAKMGTIKDGNGMDLTEAEDIKKS